MRVLNLRASSNVSGAVYDEETGTLSVTFYKGGTYTYRVDQNTVTAFEASPSPGSFVARQLKGREA